MLQLHTLRQDPQAAKERLAIKNFGDLQLLDEVLRLDDERKRLQLESDNMLARINAVSKEIGQLMGRGEKQLAENKKTEVAQLKSSLQPVADRLAGVEQNLQDLLVRIPNLPSPEVPAGNSAADNVVVRSGGEPAQLPANALPHWELIKKFRLIDFETGAKITGSGFPLYRGRGAKLQRALIQYFLDFNIAAGYTEYLPPFLVNENTAFGTGQLPDKEGQMYHVAADELYLIPTSEVPLTNIYRDELLKESDLPIRMTAFSACFRREAGSFGKDVRGLNRVHQFDKVEIVQLVHPDRSYAVLEEMVSHVERLIRSLELPYRVVKLCGGDMSFASALTYDFEVWSGAQQRWLEVSSVSNFETFQTNRMKIRFRDSGGKSRLVHSLNGSALALPRIVACLLENNQQHSRILIPPVLQSYTGFEFID